MALFLPLLASCHGVALSPQRLGLALRTDFPILHQTVWEDRPLVYLDSAATSQKPTAVIDAMRDHMQKDNANVHRGAHLLSVRSTESYEGARDKVSSLINAYRREEVVFTRGATEAINLVAQSWGRAELGEGDEVVLSVMEHHANLVPWQQLAVEKGVVLKFAQLNASECLDVPHLVSLITPRTKLVSVVHVSNALDVDFLVASGHKMCGPTGIGFLWGRYSLLDAMPPWQSGGEMIRDVFFDHSTFSPPPAKFEAGTPAITQAIGLGAAIDYLNEIGMHNIEAYEQQLGAYLFRRLKEVPGLRLYGPDPADGIPRAALCAFTSESVHASDLSAFLDQDGVAIRTGHHCTQPLHRLLGIAGSARASLYIYNTEDEVDAFVASLRSTLDMFEGMGG